MALKRIKTIAVDEKFFNEVFEKQRKELQKQLGVINLSQPNFTKLIEGITIKKLKTNISNFPKKRRKKSNGFNAF